MTNKEIKLSARKNISQNMGNCVSLTAFLFAVFVFLGLCELALFMLFKRIGWEYFFSWQGIKDHVSVRLFWFLDLIVIIPFASFEMWTVRRFFVDIARADSYVGSRQYINSHSYVYYSHTMTASRGYALSYDTRQVISVSRALRIFVTEKPPHIKNIRPVLIQGFVPHPCDVFFKALFYKCRHLV